MSDREAPPPGHRAGFAALIGRPNVGKSTLMNALLERKLSIVTPKPQTTRHRILGILNRPAFQLVLVDTPGIHAGQKRMLNKYMNRSAQSSLGDADLIVFVVEALRWGQEDEQVLERIRNSERPVLAIVNKVDRVHPKERLLPFLQMLTERHPFVEVIPLSAHRAADVARLPEVLARHLPESPPLFAPEQYTDRSESFRVAEIIREKLTLRLQEELPYGLTVEIERMGSDEGRYVIGAIIWVEREGQKAIVIGEGGERLRDIGRAARLDLNELCGRRVHLELWVKVKDNWADSAQALKQFGYDNS